MEQMNAFRTKITARDGSQLARKIFTSEPVGRISFIWTRKHRNDFRDLYGQSRVTICGCRTTRAHSNKVVEVGTHLDECCQIPAGRRPGGANNKLRGQRKYASASGSPPEDVHGKRAKACIGYDQTKLDNKRRDIAWIYGVWSEPHVIPV